MSQPSKHLKDLMGKDDDLKLVTDELGSDASFIYSFDCPPIDIPLGGGLHSGKVYEFFGEESHGKSTFALMCLEPFIKYWKDRGEDKIAVLWIESESALDKIRAKFMGVPIEYIITKETDIFEEAAEKIKAMLERCVQKKMKLLIVWDTLAATATRSEKEKGMNAGGLMEKPRLIKQMFRDITGDLGKTDSTLIILNQVYTKMTMYGDPFDSPGGKGLKHHASVRSRVKRVLPEITETLPNGEQRIRGIKIELTHIKNKLTVPKQTSFAVVDLLNGLDPIETCVQFLKAKKIIHTKSGGYATMEAPVSYAEKPKKKGDPVKPPEMVEVSFQNTKRFRELMDTKYPHLLEWTHYLIYNYFASNDIAVKTKNIKKLWEYEEKFFGEKRTVLTDREMEVAQIIFKDLARGLGSGEQ